MIDSIERTLTRVDLELAREPDRPEGDATDRYTVLAPLDSEGRIDAQRWRNVREYCRVVREQDGQRARGLLVHGPGGRWLVRYEGDAQPDDAGFRFETERFRAGEYVSIERGERTHVYRVVSTRPV